MVCVRVAVVAALAVSGCALPDHSGAESSSVEGGGRCEVEPGAGEAVVYRGRVLASEGAQSGEVAVLGDRIACVGASCGPEFPDATIVECGSAVISPALVNPHDHMAFNELGPLELTGERYDHRHEWRGELSAPPNPSGTGPGDPGSRWNELRHLLGGTTSVVGSGSASDIIRHLDDLRPRDREQGFREVVYDTFPLGDSGAKHDDVLEPPEGCDWDYRRDAFEASRFPAYLSHVAEGIGDYAAEEFRCQSTGLGGARDFVQANASHIHSVGLGANDYDRMARAGTRLVWSPRTNLALYGVTADVRAFDRLGGTIALGTDWAYTGSATMFRELACADAYSETYLDGAFTDRELWEMATRNAAVAAGNDHLIGSLAPGKVADLLIVRGAHDYRSVIEAESSDVLLVTVAGEPMFGDRELLGGLGDACDPIDVCGEARGVCLSRAVGTSYDELAAAVSDHAYPVFFCGEPPGEPTCVPSRPGEFTGEPSGEDRTGDGVPDDLDLCPDTFQPIRPIDGAQQADADGDGLGDTCDATPVAADIDGDGAANDADNCPYAANPDQADADGDGRGDACDACPAAKNPHGPCPPPSVTIREIHEEIGDGEPVAVFGAVVTGVFDEGAMVQDPSPAGGDPELSGVTVFTGSRPDVEVGDLVDITGQRSDFFGNIEIAGARMERVGSGEPIEPVDVSVQEAASGAFQGVLVRLTDGEVTDADYDCSVDHPNCDHQGLWEVGGAVLVYDRLYGGGDWSARKGQLPVAGVMMLGFDRHRLMPRAAADFP